jgi:hypothetical protein
MRFITSAFVSFSLTLLWLLTAKCASAQPMTSSLTQGQNMTISGKFDVKLTPLDTFASGKNGVNLGRMSIEKTFHGDLAATSKGEMLSAMTPTQGSAGYVAIEQVTGLLTGKQGSFVLQHFGIMNNGEKRLVLEVVPDSGTGELKGLSGKMTIDIDNSQHFYQFDFEL